MDKLYLLKQNLASAKDVNDFYNVFCYLSIFFKFPLKARKADTLFW